VFQIPIKITNYIIQTAEFEMKLTSLQKTIEMRDVEKSELRETLNQMTENFHQKQTEFETLSLENVAFQKSLAEKVAELCRLKADLESQVCIKTRNGFGVENCQI